MGKGMNGRGRVTPEPSQNVIFQVGDFGDAINWPTPGEIAHKSVQVSLRRGMGRMELCLHVYIWLFKLSKL